MGTYGDGKERKKRSDRAKEGESEYGDDFVGWINLSLGDEKKEMFDGWFAGSSFWENFVFFASDGCHISVKPNTRDGGFIATAIHRRCASPNYGYGVSARARTADVALGRLVFTLTILAREEDWAKVQPLADPDRW